MSVWNEFFSPYKPKLHKYKLQWRYKEDNTDIIELRLNQDSITVIDSDKFGDVCQGRHTYYKGKDKSTGYAKFTSYITKKTTSLHRILLPGCIQVDHISGDGLDNRMINLRPATAVINSNNCRLRITNTSGVNGVWDEKSRNRFVASDRRSPKKSFVYGGNSNRSKAEAFALACQARALMDEKTGCTNGRRPKRAK